MKAMKRFPDELFPVLAEAILEATDRRALVNAAWQYAAALMLVRHEQGRHLDLAREVVMIQVESYLRRSKCRQRIARRALADMVVAADEAAAQAVAR